MILAHSTLNLVQDQVRQNALSSFEFYANSVLASGLDEALCAAVQDLINDREDVTISTTRPRALAIAVHGWLATQSVVVLTTAELPRTQVVQWLGLDVEVSQENASYGVVLDVLSNAVRLQFL